jgi:hypothetical protein
MEWHRFVCLWLACIQSARASHAISAHFFDELELMCELRDDDDDDLLLVVLAEAG